MLAALLATALLAAQGPPPKSIACSGVEPELLAFSVKSVTHAGKYDRYTVSADIKNTGGSAEPTNFPQEVDIFQDGHPVATIPGLAAAPGAVVPKSPSNAMYSFTTACRACRSSLSWRRSRMIWRSARVEVYQHNDRCHESIFPKWRATGKPKVAAGMPFLEPFKEPPFPVWPAVSEMPWHRLSAGNLSTLQPGA